ncbi:MAG TPA: hypothetical protein VFE34_18245 [Dongiaceae bacterium]|nr:hypothetical protein [Dongiaceae bacterium]
MTAKPNAASHAATSFSLVMEDIIDEEQAHPGKAGVRQMIRWR